MQTKCYSTERYIEQRNHLSNSKKSSQYRSNTSKKALITYQELTLTKAEAVRITSIIVKKIKKNNNNINSPLQWSMRYVKKLGKDLTNEISN